MVNPVEKDQHSPCIKEISIIIYLSFFILSQYSSAFALYLLKAITVFIPSNASSDIADATAYDFYRSSTVL
jgi:hypothetical protein